MRNITMLIAAVAAAVLIVAIYTLTMSGMAPPTSPPAETKLQSEQSAPAPTQQGQSEPNARPDTPGGTEGPSTTGSAPTSDAPDQVRDDVKH